MASGCGKSTRKPEPEEQEDRAEKRGPCFTRRVFTGSGTVELAAFGKFVDTENGERRVFSVIAGHVAWNPTNGGP